MKRILVFSAVVAAFVAVAGTASAVPTTASATCTPTGYIQDSIDLTAALVNPAVVNGVVDATGCNIGVYYAPGNRGRVTDAEIFGANYYGVLNNGSKVNIAQSKIHDIGESPFTGAQHGVAVRFVTDSGAKGSITKNTITLYQKGGIVVLGSTDSAEIANNTVTGLGPVDFIAQNGIEIGFGSSGSVTHNQVDDHSYTGDGGASSGGILVIGGDCYGAPLTVGNRIGSNTLDGNDVGIWLFQPDASCTIPPSTPTKIVVVRNKISNDAVNNTSGWGTPGQGYQAGISDAGNGDKLIKNKICGAGYTPVPPPPYLFFIDQTLGANLTLTGNKSSSSC